MIEDAECLKCGNFVPQISDEGFCPKCEREEEDNWPQYEKEERKNGN